VLRVDQRNAKIAGENTMPLRDRFHSPVNDKHHWSAVHGQRPGELVRTLFDLLPVGFSAGPCVYLGSPFEVVVSVDEDASHGFEGDTSESGTAVHLAAAPTWTAFADFVDFDEYEVRIYDGERERRLVAESNW
jgi:hypothetical protein